MTTPKINLSSKKGNKGFCLCCEKDVRFIQYGTWLRDEYRCSNCDSIPRNRALIRGIQKFVPDYQEKKIHESSPGNQSSDHLKAKCKNYSASQFFPNSSLGKIYNGFRCENLENLTFENNVFDLFVTADVFEHVMNPEKAFREIARVLKPGGLHIFTVPWYPGLITSRTRAKQKLDGNIEFVEKPVYHGNPISKDGSLVTVDWGLDFCDKVFEYSGMTTTIYLEYNKKLGLDAKFLEVFISRKQNMV